LTQCFKCYFENGTITPSSWYNCDDHCIYNECIQGTIVSTNLRQQCQCPDGFHQDMDSEECCDCVEDVIEECSRRTVTEYLVYTINSCECTSCSPVEYSICSGTCEGSERGAVLVDGVVYPGQRACSCCRGSASTLIDVNFDCNGQTVQAKVNSFTECACMESECEVLP
jgi:hypothetical protein